MFFRSIYCRLVRQRTSREQPLVQLLLRQAAPGSFATTLTPWMVLVNALRTVFKAAATIAFVTVSIIPESLNDDSHTILSTQSISCSLLGGGIVPPHSVGVEPVFVTTRSERQTQPPDVVRTFLHWRSVGIPIVEIAG